MEVQTQINPTIEISLDEYRKLMSDSLFLCCLCMAGVEAWFGYEIALNLYEEETIK